MVDRLLGPARDSDSLDTIRRVGRRAAYPALRSVRATLVVRWRGGRGRAENPLEPYGPRPRLVILFSARGRGPARDGFSARKSTPQPQKEVCGERESPLRLMREES